jgi:hypothetical protein
MEPYEDLAEGRRVTCRTGCRRTFDGLDAHPEVCNAMNGPSEFHVIGR